MIRLLRAAAWGLSALCLGVTLAGQQPPSFEDVVRNLRNPDPKARIESLRLLRESRHAEAAVPVAALVNDPVDEIQLEAIAAELSFFVVQAAPSKKYVALVVEVRGKDQAAQLFDQGPLATWPVGAPPEVLDALLKAVDDENPRVRGDAIYAAGVVARPPLTDASAALLIRALDHYEPSVRMAAARVAGRLKVTQAGDALINAVNDSTPAVRFAAMRALGEVREERAVQALVEQLKFYDKGEGAWSALDGLARIAHASSAELFRARLADKDPLLRMASAEGIGRIGNAGDTIALQSALDRESTDTVRVALAFALVKVGQRPYVSRLVDALGPTHTALQAQSYLLELGPSIVPDVAPRLQDPSAAVRGGVAEAIGALGTADQIPVLAAFTKDRDGAVAKKAALAIERIKRHP
jgi:HEAT repeat protein